MEDISEIDNITFGISSAEEIKATAVCKVDNTKLSGYGSVYDPRMGITLEGTNKCETCGSDMKNCTGHFGYIELNDYIIHPLFYRIVHNYLKCICIECNRLLVKPVQLDLCGILRFSGAIRFAKIQEKIEKTTKCSWCDHVQPKYSYSTTENSFSMTYEDRDKDNPSINMPVDVHIITKIFENFPDEDLAITGSNPEYFHPRNLIMKVFPVIPPCVRPPIVLDGNISDDDLTIQMIEIIKHNNNLKTLKNEEGENYTKIYNNLRFRISTFYDNSKKFAKHTTNNRPIKALKERMSGKEGVIRTHLLGKRCNQTARTVISPDPTLEMDEIGIPESIADNLTFPELVTPFNMDRLTKLVNTGGANFISRANGSKINLEYALYKRGTMLEYDDVVERKGKKIHVKDKVMELQPGDKLYRDNKLYTETTLPIHRKYNLQVGEIVHRKLQRGDYVVLNRQPTLHMGGMLGMRVVPRRGINQKTITMNLACTSSLNADFDKQTVKNKRS